MVAEMTYRELLSAVVDPKKIKEEYPSGMDSVDELILRLMLRTCPEIVFEMWDGTDHSLDVLPLAGHCPPSINNCEDCWDQHIRHDYVLKNPHHLCYEEAVGKTVEEIIEALSNGWNWDGKISSMIKNQSNTMRITDEDLISLLRGETK